MKEHLPYVIGSDTGLQMADAEKEKFKLDKINEEFINENILNFAKWYLHTLIRCYL